MMGDSLNSLLECTICIEMFKQPKGLPCQHTYCLPCLEGLQIVGGEITCPQCRGQHKVPTGGIQAFPNSLMAMALLDQFKDTTSCEDCRGVVRKIGVCEHCKQHLCTECLLTHYKLSSEIQSMTKAIDETGADESDAWRKLLANIAEERAKLAMVFDEMIMKLHEKQKECANFLNGLDNGLRLLRDSRGNIRTRIEQCKTSDELKKMHDIMGTIAKLREQILIKTCDYDFKLIYKHVDLTNLVEAQWGERKFQVDEVHATQCDKIDQDKQAKPASTVPDLDQDIDLVDATGLFSKKIPSGPRNVDYRRKNPTWEVIPYDSTLDTPEYPVYSSELNKLFCLFGNTIYSYDLNSQKWDEVCSTAAAPLHFTINDSGKILIADGKGFIIHDLRADVYQSSRIEIPIRIEKIIQVCSYGREFTVLDGERRCLMTFDEDGRFIREFGSEELELEDYKPKFMCADRYGRIYVADMISLQSTDYCDHADCTAGYYYNTQTVTIQIFSWHGEPIKSQLFEKNRFCPEHELENSHRIGGICVDDDQFLSLSRDRGNVIAVYNLAAGEFHCEIGDTRKRPNELKTPGGLCMMPDGRMVVCDTGNERLLMI